MFTTPNLKFSFSPISFPCLIIISMNKGQRTITLNKLNTTPTKVAFIVYAIILLIALFARDRYDYSIPYTELLSRNHKFDLFDSIIKYYGYTKDPSNQARFWEGMVNLYGNIVMSIPAGAFLTITFKKFRNWYCFYPGVIFIFTTLETLQLLTLRGVMDIDDIILNVLGAIIGRILVAIICLMTKTPPKLED